MSKFNFWYLYFIKTLPLFSLVEFSFKYFSQKDSKKKYRIVMVTKTKDCNQRKNYLSSTQPFPYIKKYIK